MLAQAGQIWRQLPLHLFEQRLPGPGLAQALDQGSYSLTLGMTHQQEHLTTERLGHARLGLLGKGVAGALGQERQQIGGHRRTMPPLPGAERQQGEQ